MDALIIKQTLSDAFEALYLAENELCKPAEDVVTPIACRNVQSSVEGFLRSYLLSVNQNPSDEKTFEELLQLCIASDNAFESIDLSGFICKQACHQDCESGYCLLVGHLLNCYSKAQVIRTIVLSKIKLATTDYLS